MRGHLATESDWLVAMRRFFFTTQGARIRKSRRPGRAKSHNFHSREEKTHFQLGRFLQRVKTKTKAKWHVSSFLQQNDIINEEPSPRNQYLFNGDFVTWPGEVKWVFCFSSSSQMIRQGDPSF